MDRQIFFVASLQAKCFVFSPTVEPVASLQAAHQHSLVPQSTSKPDKNTATSHPPAYLPGGSHPTGHPHPLSFHFSQFPKLNSNNSIRLPFPPPNSTRRPASQKIMSACAARARGHGEDWRSNSLARCGKTAVEGRVIFFNPLAPAPPTPSLRLRLLVSPLSPPRLQSTPRPVLLPLLASGSRPAGRGRTRRPRPGPSLPLFFPPVGTRVGLLIPLALLGARSICPPARRADSEGRSRHLELRARSFRAPLPRGVFDLRPRRGIGLDARGDGDWSCSAVTCCWTRGLEGPEVD